MDAIKGILDKIDDLFKEFTWPRFFALLSFAVIIFVGITLYERYTSSFLLSRLQRSADLIAKIQAIEPGITNSSAALKSDYEALLSQASAAIQEKPLSLDFIPGKLRLSTDSVSKFFAGGAVWFFLAILALSRRPTGNDNPGAAFSNLIAFGGFSGLVGIFVPPIWWPWFHIFMFPFILFILIILMFVPVAYFIGKRNSK